MVEQQSYLAVDGSQSPPWGSTDGTVEKWYNALAPDVQASVQDWVIHAEYFFAVAASVSTAAPAYYPSAQDPTGATDNATVWWGGLTAATRQSMMNYGLARQYNGAKGAEAMAPDGSVPGLPSSAMAQPAWSAAPAAATATSASAPAASSAVAPAATTSVPTALPRMIGIAAIAAAMIAWEMAHKKGDGKPA